jgi:hypothetical protein
VPAKTAHLINDLCSAILLSHTTGSVKVGVIKDTQDRCFNIEVAAAQAVPLGESMTFTQLIDSHHRRQIIVARTARFVIAAHIASSLLLGMQSPWMAWRITKDDYQFWITTDRKLAFKAPHVSKLFKSSGVQPVPGSNSTNTAATNYAFASNSPIDAEEAARSVLQTVGVMILELVFGHGIQHASTYQQNLLPSGQSGPYTDICTAQEWRKGPGGVAGECGPAIDEVVRRCLDCSFGPRPDLGARIFQEAVYEQVILPLVNYDKAFAAATP